MIIFVRIVGNCIDFFFKTLTDRLTPNYQQMSAATRTKTFTKIFTQRK